MPKSLWIKILCVSSTNTALCPTKSQIEGFVKSGYAATFNSGVANNQLVDSVTVNITSIYVKGVGIVLDYVEGTSTAAQLDLYVQGDFNNHSLYFNDNIMWTTTNNGSTVDVTKYLDLRLGWLEYPEDEATYACTILATTSSSNYYNPTYSMETDGIFLPYGEGAELAYNSEMFGTSYAVNTLEYFIQAKGITNPSNYYYWFKIGGAL